MTGGARRGATAGGSAVSPPDARPAVIETRGLTKALGGRTVVDGLELSVHAGEVYGFLGPNGAGKTTTLRMLLGLLAPDSGSATVLGFDSQRQGPALRRLVGYVSQQRSLYLDLTVEQNMLFFGRMYGLGPERLLERMAGEVERFQLQGELHRLLGSVPTGVQRRCSLAIALLHQPKLLILDEPTSGMDTTSRREFWAFLGGLVAAETTVILTTHHLEEVQVCDRLCLMLDGRLRFEGTPGGMVEASPGPVLLVSTDRLENAHQILKKEFGASLLGNRVRVQRPEVRPDEVLRVLEAAGIGGARVESVAPTLEDAFVRTAGRPENED
jgi:ABC-2 type transport system ATP-binding protein